MKTDLTVWILTLIICYPCYSQSITPIENNKEIAIKGQCIDSQSKVAIEERISILVFDSSGRVNIRNFISDDSGKFNLSIPKQQSILIRFSSVNYSDIEFPIRSFPSDTIYIGKVEMQLKTTQLPEVTVTAQKKLIELSFNKVIYNPEADSLNAGINTLDMLEKVPMIDVGNNNQIFVGNSSAYLFLINGRVKGILLQNPGAYFKTIPANLIKSVEVNTSPPAKYSSIGIKYIVDIQIEKKLVDGIYGDIGVGISTKQQDASLFLLLKRGKLGIQVNSNYNRLYYSQMASDYSLAIKNNYFSKQASRFNTLSHVFSPGLNITLDADTTFIISGDVFGTLGKANNINGIDVLSTQNGIASNNKRQTTNNSDNGFIFYSLTGEKTLNKKKDLLFISYRGYYSPGNMSNSIKEFRGDGLLSYAYFSVGKAKMNEHTFQVEYVKNYTPKISLSSGIKSIIRKIHSAENFNNEKDTSSEYAQKIVSVFSDFKITRNKYQFQIGLSLDYSQFKNNPDYDIVNFKKEYLNFSPSVSISKSLKKYQFISLRFSEYLKRPGLQQISIVTNYGTPESLTRGNATINPQTTYNAAFEYSKLIKHEPLITSVYINTSNNEIISSKKVFNDSTLMTSYTNQGKMMEFGLNFSYRFKLLKKITFGINSSVGSLTIANRDDKKEKQSNLNYSIAPSITYMIPGKVLFGFRNYFYSRVTTFQGYSSGYWDCRITFSRRFFQNTLNSTLMIYNPFQKEQNVKNIYNGALFSEISKVVTPQRFISLTIHFEFGDYLKSSYKRNEIKIKNTDLK